LVISLRRINSVYRFIHACGFWLQPLEPFDEQKENPGAEAEQHYGDAGGDAPKRAGGRATIVAAAGDDVAGHGDKEFKDAAAQEPARGAFEECVGFVRFGGATENNRPDQPEDENGNKDAQIGLPIGTGHIFRLVVIQGVRDFEKQVWQIKNLESGILDYCTKQGKKSG